MTNDNHIINDIHITNGTCITNDTHVTDDTHIPGLGQLINLIVNFYKLTVKLINLT